MPESVRPFRIGEIDHVVLRCRDQDRTLDFYTRVLGLAEERRIAQIGLIQLRAGRSMIDLVPAGGPRVETSLIRVRTGRHWSPADGSFSSPGAGRG